MWKLNVVHLVQFTDRGFLNVILTTFLSRKRYICLPRGFISNFFSGFNQSYNNLQIENHSISPGSSSDFTKSSLHKPGTAVRLSFSHATPWTSRPWNKLQNTFHWSASTPRASGLFENEGGGYLRRSTWTTRVIDRPLPICENYGGSGQNSFCAPWVYKLTSGNFLVVFRLVAFYTVSKCIRLQLKNY